MAKLFQKLRALFTEEASNEEVWSDDNSAEVDLIVGYFDHRDDRAQIRNAVLARYGTGIRTEEDDGGNTLETYTHDEVAIQIDAGMWSTVTVGWGEKIVNACASLFSEKGSRFSLTAEDESTDLSEVEALLNTHRRMGGSKTALVRTDKRSVQCGSALLFLEFRNDYLYYSSIDPGKVKAAFHPAIEENGKTRPTDKCDIEDATKVVIQTGENEEGLKSYIAIFPRQAEWPQGRYVVYQSQGDGKDVPAVGSKDTWDWEQDGEPANPLSWWANQNSDHNLPEVPLCIIKGGNAPDDELLPISTSLHHESLEHDIDASHIRSTSQQAATGTKKIIRDSKARTMPLPRSLVGAVDLPPGMDLEYVAHDSGASADAYKVMRDEMVDSAAARGVPDYMVASEDHTLDASSGVALSVKTRPLRMKREERADLNQPAIRKMFDIEIALLSIFGAMQDAELKLMQLATQTWEPGSIKLPENKKEKTERIEKLKQMGVYDEIAAIQDHYDFDTIDEAIEEYERIKQRKKDYPPLAADEKRKPVGLLRGRDNAR